MELLFVKCFEDKNTWLEGLSHKINIGDVCISVFIFDTAS